MEINRKVENVISNATNLITIYVPQKSFTQALSLIKKEFTTADNIKCRS